MFEASIRFRVKSCSFLLYLWCAASSYSKGCFRVRLMGWLQLMTYRAAARGIVLLHNLLQRHRELWERDLMIVFSSIIPQSFMLATSSWFLRSQIASISASSSAQRCCQALHPSTGFCYWWNLVHSVKSWRCIVLLLLSYSSLASSAATNPRHPHRLHLHKDALSHRHPVSCPLTSSLCCCLTARTRRASLLAPRAVSPCPAQTKLQQLQH